MKKIAWFLTLIGALNWGLVAVGGLFLGGEINLVTLILGTGNLAYIVYALVGISALYIMMGHCGCKKCDNEACVSCKNGSCDVHK